MIPIPDVAAHPARILIVDDERHNRQLLEVMLGAEGFVLEMPGCGGPELLSRLRLRTPDVRVLYMSGYTEQSAVRKFGIERGLPFVQKPFTAAEFLRRVREALDR